MNKSFADLPLKPLGYVAQLKKLLERTENLKKSLKFNEFKALG